MYGGMSVWGIMYGGMSVWGDECMGNGCMGE